MTRRVIATIHFNTDRSGSRHRTGAFDFAEFAKLMRDFERFRESLAKTSMPSYYVIYSLNSPVEGKELCLFLHEVERIKRDE